MSVPGQRNLDSRFVGHIPVRVNDIDGGVAATSLDEDRPAISVGAEGHIAVASAVFPRGANGG